MTPEPSPSIRDLEENTRPREKPDVRVSLNWLNLFRLMAIGLVVIPCEGFALRNISGAYLWLVVAPVGFATGLIVSHLTEKRWPIGRLQA